MRMKFLDPNLNTALVDARCRALRNNHESFTNPLQGMGGLLGLPRVSQRIHQDSSGWIHCVRLWLLPLALLCAKTAAFETMAYGPLQLQTNVEARVGLQYGTGINYGLGAFDDLAATERATIALALEAKLSAHWALDTSQIYGGISVVAATTSLDGEISGQFARAGDQAFDISLVSACLTSEYVSMSSASSSSISIRNSSSRAPISSSCPSESHPWSSPLRLESRMSEGSSLNT